MFLIFMFPLSVLDASVVPLLQLLLSLFGIIFALYYQYVVCARAVYDFTQKEPKPKMPPFTRIAKKLK